MKEKSHGVNALLTDMHFVVDCSNICETRMEEKFHIGTKHGDSVKITIIFSKGDVHSSTCLCAFI